MGKVVNLASRTAKFVRRDRACRRPIPTTAACSPQAAADGEAIAAAYEACDYNRAMRLIMALADRANQYVDARAPWKLRNDPAGPSSCRTCCTIALNLFRQLAVYLAPVLPRLRGRPANCSASRSPTGTKPRQPLVGTPVSEFTHMMQRVEPAQVEAMIAESQEEPAVTESATPAAPAATVRRPQPTAAADSAAAALAAEPLVAEPIAIDDFTKVDLRVARVVAAEDVPKAKKLLKLTLSLGGDKRRTVFAGIKSAYKPEQLVGRLVICVANLAPRKMKFGIERRHGRRRRRRRAGNLSAHPRQRREAGAARALGKRIAGVQRPISRVPCSRFASMLVYSGSSMLTRREHGTQDFSSAGFAFCGGVLSKRFPLRSVVTGLARRNRARPDARGAASASAATATSRDASCVSPAGAVDCSSRPRSASAVTTASLLSRG